MSDEVIQELWKFKDRIALEHGYDIDVLVAYLQSKERPGGQEEVAGLRATTEVHERDVQPALASGTAED